MISLSPKAMMGLGAVGLGVAAVGTAAWGWKSSGEDPTVTDTKDRLGYTASAVMVGVPAVGALTAGGIVLGGTIKGLNSVAGGKAALTGMRSSVTGSLGGGIKSLGRSFKNIGSGMNKIPKGARGPLGAVMLLGAATAALGYNLASEAHPDTAAYGTPDGAGGTEYNQQPTRSRMNAMNASGDMVFGLNNLRHG